MSTRKLKRIATNTLDNLLNRPTIHMLATNMSPASLEGNPLNRPVLLTDVIKVIAYS